MVNFCESVKKKPKENKGKKEKKNRKGADPASFIISLIKGFSTLIVLKK
jgi:hypothetical protein